MFFNSVKEIDRLREEMNRSLKAGFQHADFSASADFYACADFSAYPHMNFHHNADF